MLLSLFSALVACGAQFVPSSGPVYVNPNAAAVPTFDLSEAPTGDRVTQTVYGFLDFTTTIGNTVMVFSPQSAAGNLIYFLLACVIRCVTRFSPKTN